MAQDKRFLAEWESCESILLTLPSPNTDWQYMLPEALSQYKLILEALTNNGEHVILLTDDASLAIEVCKDCTKNNLVIIKAEYNDTWIRDYGPLSITKNGELRALDFGFNGWGLKFASDKDNLVNLYLADRFILESGIYRNNRDFVLEGGSVETDGEYCLLTTSRCLCSPNRNGGKDKSELNKILYDRLGIDHILWLDYGALAGDDTDSHIDTLARMAPHNTIVFTGCHDETEEHFEELLKMRAQLMLFRNREGAPFNLVELPLPDPVFDPIEGTRLPATYANYLVTEKNLFMPVYGQKEKDELACKTIKIVFPNHNVIPVNCTALLRQHGSLHCSTMQLPAGVVNSTVFLQDK